MFRDRNDAAEQLSEALGRFSGRHPLILAIPRGAVPMARILAERLGGEFDVVLVRKIGSPFNPEVAVGAVDEAGNLYVAPHAAAHGADADYLAREKSEQLRLIAHRRGLYSPAHAPVDPAGRTVIIVDDGLATGATMLAALQATAARNPSELVCAVPVAARESLAAIRGMGYHYICLHELENFGSVGQYYRSFPQVDDREVVELLKR